MKYAKKLEQRMVCSNKVDFLKKNEAWWQAVKIFQRTGGNPMGAYKCHYCDYYHLTSKGVKPSDFFWKRMEQWFRVPLR